MTRASSGLHIIIAAIVAVVFTIIAQLFITAPDSLTVSLIALGTFLGGVVTPYINFYLSQQKTKVKASKSPTKRTSKGTDGRTLYVGNLPFKITEEEVENLFGRYGDVTDVRLVKDRRTGRKKGYGFVEMDVTGADLALAKLNDNDFEGRTLKVRTAHAEQDEK
ncbi:RNA-binding protein [Aliidiomarina shirensis]|uniref:RNA-binding protein n=1 Tax=Aliidiomarina shirensis TaxID=1048642 RepID=A0A432WSE2_9GAMM|nr:RNA-binding protein [Aliidiomarina shirensis]RUO36693.1 RNA-binding protein [Aliidiomarina shirensis]